MLANNAGAEDCPYRRREVQGADLLLAAQCAAFAMPDFHERLLMAKTVAIACPKLDNAQRHLEKLAAILRQSDVKSLSVARMEVPCCAGLVRLARAAIEASGKEIPLREIVVSTRGGVKAESGKLKDEDGKACVGKAAALRQVSISDYVRMVTVSQAQRETQQADAGVIMLTPDEQLQFWRALAETQEPTPVQRELGAIIQGAK